MAAKKTTNDSGVTEKAKTTAEEPQAAGTPKKIADLSIGDIVAIPGFDGPRTIRGAAKVTGGADAGKLDVALRDEAGDVEHACFGPDEVQVVGKAAKGGKDGVVPAGSAARKTGPKNKGAKAVKPEGAKKAKKTKAPKPPKEKKTSALDAAAKVLGEKGEPMNCQELIKAMSEKGYWKSPGGLTPHATLYSAIAGTSAPSRSDGKRSFTMLRMAWKPMSGVTTTQIPQNPSRRHFRKILQDSSSPPSA